MQETVSDFFARSLLYLLLLTVGLSVVGLSVGGCDVFSSGGDNGSSFPETEEEIQQATENTEEIRQEVKPIINDEIAESSSSGENIDISMLADKVEGSELVKSAEPTSSGAGIVVEQEDGTYSNLRVVSQDDDRVFDRTESSSSSEISIADLQRLKHSHGIFRKKSSVSEGEALILAPFQSDFEKDLSRLSDLFESAGFSVDLFKNGNADIDKFRGDFLAQYDAVFIDTHGVAGAVTSDGTQSTLLGTGTDITAFNSLPSDLQKAVGRFGNLYISVPWLNKTLNNSDFTAGPDDFSATWVFASACESSKVDSGPSSMTNAFLDNGAGGYTGFDKVVNTELAEATSETVISKLTSGRSLSTATQETKNGSGLSSFVWLAYLAGFDSFDVNMLDSNQRNNNSYYLFDPSRVVGIASVQPSSGPPGTEVTYDVEIQDAFLDQVNNVDLFIDNTNEDIPMEQISESVWRNDPKLTAPPADSYPRVDTFIFTAYDSDGTELGEGSDTFTITEPEQSTSETKYARKWR